MGWKWAAVAVAVTAAAVMSRNYAAGAGWDKEAVLEVVRRLSERLGNWVVPLYISVHTLSITLCLPYAIFFEAAASLLFGFFPALLCVFAAKVLGASLSFTLGRVLFRSSSTAMEWALRNKYFNLLSRGVEQDGWKFVLLARFSPIPSYVINYALAATQVGFFLDFLPPTVIGCLPMILQNTSIGSLAGAAVASTTGSQQKSQIFSFVFPLLGIVSSVLISLRIKKYTSEMTAAAKSVPSKLASDKDANDSDNNVNSSPCAVDQMNKTRKRQ